MRGSRAGLRGQGDAPSTRTVPASGRRRPSIISSVVVLPAPLGPRMPKNSPSATSKVTPSTARVSPYANARSATSIAPMRPHASDWSPGASRTGSAVPAQPFESRPRTTRRPTDIRARSAASSAQISSRVLTARETTTPSRVLPGLDPGLRRRLGVGGVQHLGGQLGVHGVQVVAQRRAGHRLPAVLPRQREDPCDQRGQPEPLAEREVQPGYLRRVDALAVGDLDDPEQDVRRVQDRHPGRQLLRHVRPHQRLAARHERLQLAAGHQVRQLGHHGLHAGGEELDRRVRVQRRSPVGDQPPGGALDQGAHLDPHPGLHGRVEHVVVGRQLLAQAERAEDLPGHEVGVGELGGTGPGLPGQPRPEGHAGAVDQVVDHLGHDDLPAQRVVPDLGLEALPDGAREVGHQVEVEVRVVGQVGGQQLVGEHDLGPGQQHRQLRHAQALAAVEAAAHLTGRRETLELAVEEAVLLEPLHPGLVHVQEPGGVGRGVGEREVLLVVVAEHQLGDLVGHLGQQGVALLAGEVPRGDHPVEQDLDVHLVVGGVHAGGVVDEVGVDPAALAAAAPTGVLDPAELGEPEVAALADAVGPQVLTVDADGVVGLVAGLRRGSRCSP